jgi:hypothetical protein
MEEAKKRILIYVPSPTNRVRFVLRFIFKDVFGLEYEICKDEEAFLSADCFRLNYSNKFLPDILFLESKGLLFERDINSQEIEMIEYEGLPAFYPVYDKKSFLPFDLFSAVFYLLSRYEEYLPYRKDNHGRFPAVESLAYQKGFLNRPIVDEWLILFEKKLSQAFPELIFKQNKFEFKPTIDVDVAYAYKMRGPIRLSGAIFKDVIALDYRRFIQRFRVLSGVEQDPYDTFDFILRLHSKYKIPSIFFILLGELSTYDKNIANTKRNFHILLKHLDDYATVGIHPSYDSTGNPEQLKSEVKLLSNVLHREVVNSRQHFLKIHLPVNYRELLKLGIRNDYTMGYADQTGFRAGTSRSFNFYDLDFDSETLLRLHPFAIMEGTYKDYMKLHKDEVLGEMKILIDRIIAVKGTFISLWHNESLSDQARWEGWRQIYMEMVDYAAKAIEK